MVGFLAPIATRVAGYLAKAAPQAYPKLAAGVKEFFTKGMGAGLLAKAASAKSAVASTRIMQWAIANKFSSGMIVGSATAPLFNFLTGKKPNKDATAQDAQALPR